MLHSEMNYLLCKKMRCSWFLTQFSGIKMWNIEEGIVVRATIENFEMQIKGIMIFFHLVR